MIGLVCRDVEEAGIRVDLLINNKVRRWYGIPVESDRLLLERMRTSIDSGRNPNNLVHNRCTESKYFPFTELTNYVGAVTIGGSS